MLVLTIEPREGKDEVFIGEDIKITVLNVDRRTGQVKIGFEADGYDIKRDRNMLRKTGSITPPVGTNKISSKTDDNFGNK